MCNLGGIFSSLSFYLLFLGGLSYVAVCLEGNMRERGSLRESRLEKEVSCDGAELISGKLQTWGNDKRGMRLSPHLARSGPRKRNGEKREAKKKYLGTNPRMYYPVLPSSCWCF